MIVARGTGEVAFSLMPRASTTFFSEIQISEHQIFNRQFTKFQTKSIILNSQIFEQP
jgi:hypothetical protein